MREILCERPILDRMTVDSLRKELREEHFLATVCKRLRSNGDNNVVIWGTYNNAIRIRDYLEAEGIAGIKACVINRQYYQTGVNAVNVRNDFPQYSIEDWLEEHEETTIVVDFSFYSGELLEGYEKKVADIYVGDLMGVFILDEPYIITKNQIEENFEKLVFVYDSLCDEHSKRDFLLYLLQKNIGFYNKEYTKGPQYFEKELFCPDENLVLVDCGAFVGDTIESFIRFCNDSFAHVYSFEMDKINYEKLVSDYGDDSRLTLINKGVGKEKSVLRATLGINSASRVSEKGSDKVEIVPIDEELEGVNSISIIKMDIEGFELEALHGAEKTIKKFKPILAICLYHKYSDLILIPKAILSIWPDYKLFFRNYHNSASECVLYAVPK